MLSIFTEQLEKLALRTSPTTAIALLGNLPPRMREGLQRMRFRQTLKLAAETPFYAEEFRRRKIDVRRIRHAAELGDLYTTGDDLLKYGPEAFMTGRAADTAFETTGTSSADPKRVYFSTR